MATDQDTSRALSEAFTRRLNQLGLSRREFVKRSGISRQTLFKIENEGHTVLRATTYALLDTHLHWEEGTAFGLAMGEIDSPSQGDALSRVDRENAYRWSVVERIQSMSLEELETLVALMESHTLGESPLTTERHIELVNERLDS